MSSTRLSAEAGASGKADHPVATIVSVAAALLSVPGAFMLWRIPRCRVGRAGADVVRRMAVIVPARNEEANVPRLLDSLRRQTVAPREIVVVDDHSEDATAARARDFGVTVLQPPDKPDDWTGKTWACYHGARAADSDYLLFLDADVWLEQEGLERLGSAMARGPGVVSVQPYHVVPTLPEQFSSFFQIMMMAGVGAFTALGSRLRPAGPFGQCLLCTRQDYLSTGGHRRVRGSVLENLSLGKVFGEAGIPVRLYGGRGTLNVRMYPDGFGALIDGWSKALVDGAGASKPGMVVLASSWTGGCLLAGFALGAALRYRRPRLGLPYGLCGALTLWMLRRLGGFRLSTALLFPAHCLFFCCTFAYSALRVHLFGPVVWKGRRIARPSRNKEDS